MFLILLLIAYFVNTILKIFSNIYELHNMLCNVIIYKITFLFLLLTKQSVQCTRKIEKRDYCMDRDRFKLIHSELIQQVQCVENNLKIIYAAMYKGNFNYNLKSVEKMNLGKIARDLEELDNSDDMPEFSEEEYNTIDEIREIRNYWCHQCYLDFIYIGNDYAREKAFQKVAKKLHYDEYRTYDLFKKTEEMRLIIMKKYR